MERVGQCSRQDTQQFDAESFVTVNSTRGMNKKHVKTCVSRRSMGWKEIKENQRNACRKCKVSAASNLVIMMDGVPNVTKISS